MQHNYSKEITIKYQVKDSIELSIEYFIQDDNYDKTVQYSHLMNYTDKL